MNKKEWRTAGRNMLARVYASIGGLRGTLVIASRPNPVGLNNCVIAGLTRNLAKQPQAGLSPVIASRCRRRGNPLLQPQAGLSLVETIVAGAIVAIAALLLVSFTLTLSGISQRSAEVSQADASLTMNIALNPENMTSTRSMSITIGNSTISTSHHSYQSSGRSLSTFELPSTPGATP